MALLRRLLLVTLLLFAQMAAGGHALEHASGQESLAPEQLCELCLTAHDLGSALPSLASLPPVTPPLLRPIALALPALPALPAPQPCQRGPPAA